MLNERVLCLYCGTSNRICYSDNPFCNKEHKQLYFEWLKRKKNQKHGEILFFDYWSPTLNLIFHKSRRKKCGETDISMQKRLECPYCKTKVNPIYWREEKENVKEIILTPRDSNVILGRHGKGCRDHPHPQGCFLLISECPSCHKQSWIHCSNQTLLNKLRGDGLNG
jgi:hypothetical protein